MSWSDGGRITGYTTDLAFFGHSVGETNNEIKALITAAPGFGGPGFLLPTRNGELLRWCLANGLRIVQPNTLMTLGLYNEPRGAYLPSILDPVERVMDGAARGPFAPGRAAFSSP